MENRIRLREAVEYAKQSGKEVVKKDLATKAFRYRSQTSAYISWNAYENGKYVSLDRTTIMIICHELGVDANLLFGTPPMESDEKIESIKDVLNSDKSDEDKLRTIKSFV